MKKLATTVFDDFCKFGTNWIGFVGSVSAIATATNFIGNKGKNGEDIFEAPGFFKQKSLNIG